MLRLDRRQGQRDCIRCAERDSFGQRVTDWVYLLSRFMTLVNRSFTRVSTRFYGYRKGPYGSGKVGVKVGSLTLPQCTRNRPRQSICAAASGEPVAAPPLARALPGLRRPNETDRSRSRKKLRRFDGRPLRAEVGAPPPEDGGRLLFGGAPPTVKGGGEPPLLLLEAAATAAVQLAGAVVAGGGVGGGGGGGGGLLGGGGGGGGGGWGGVEEVAAGCGFFRNRGKEGRMEVRALRPRITACIRTAAALSATTLRARSAPAAAVTAAEVTPEAAVETPEAAVEVAATQERLAIPVAKLTASPMAAPAALTCLGEGGEGGEARGEGGEMAAVGEWLWCGAVVRGGGAGRWCGEEVRTASPMEESLVGGGGEGEGRRCGVSDGGPGIRGGECGAVVRGGG
jgi:hypothetical protein